VGRLTLEEVKNFQKTILNHFHEEGRSFPWRDTRDPYKIFVSEIMLQQTQTDRVVPKYLAWLSAFPTMGELAGAPFSLVLEYWIGLGYNRRARYLHDTCKIIQTEHSGIFPHDPKILETLPGIGPYTARAISTFAFSRPNVFIETNIRAVFIFFFYPGQEKIPDASILELIGETLFFDDPRLWYYALMDYGAILKKKVFNPNRNSRHYTKQTRFEGSLRQARGAVIRFLSDNGKARLDSISLAGSIPYETIEKAANALLSDGLISEDSGIYSVSR
jgi:A/G-specific adenine glycosylase